MQQIYKLAYKLSTKTKWEERNDLAFTLLTSAIAKVNFKAVLWWK